MKVSFFKPQIERRPHDSQAALTAGASCYAAAAPVREHAISLRRGPISKQERLGSRSEADEQHRELRRRLVSAVRAVCPPALLDRQDDLVQAAMIAVLKQEEKHGHSREVPSSYLRRAAYTAMVDEIRRLRSQNEVPLEVEGTAEQNPPDLEDPERRALSNEISNSVRACLQRLATPRRLAVTLHLLSYSVPQIAERFHWNNKQAENLVYRGLGNLRQCLEAKGMRP